MLNLHCGHDHTKGLYEFTPISNCKMRLFSLMRDLYKQDLDKFYLFLLSSNSMSDCFMNFLATSSFLKDLATFSLAPIVSMVPKQKFIDNFFLADLGISRILNLRKIGIGIGIGLLWCHWSPLLKITYLQLIYEKLILTKKIYIPSSGLGVRLFYREGMRSTWHSFKMDTTYRIPSF